MVSTAKYPVLPIRPIYDWLMDKLEKCRTLWRWAWTNSKNTMKKAATITCIPLQPVSCVFRFHYWGPKDPFKFSDKVQGGSKSYFVAACLSVCLSVRTPNRRGLKRGTRD